MTFERLSHRIKTLHIQNKWRAHLSDRHTDYAVCFRQHICRQDDNISITSRWNLPRCHEGIILILSHQTQPIAWRP